MFVLKRTYHKLENECRSLVRENARLNEECNSMIYEIRWLNNNIEFLQNKCDALASMNIPNKKAISEDDIKKMLLLCHPDKHGGKQIAHEVTQKLLAMRGK